jgi:hypothetical protein
MSCWPTVAGRLLEDPGRWRSRRYQPLLGVQRHRVSARPSPSGDGDARSFAEAGARNAACVPLRGHLCDGGARRAARSSAMRHRKDSDTAGDDPGGRKRPELQRHPARRCAGARYGGGVCCAPAPAVVKPALERPRRECCHSLLQVRSRPVHELAHGSFGEAQLAGHLGPAATLQCRLDERVALALRQRGDSGERRAREHPRGDGILQHIGTRDPIVQCEVGPFGPGRPDRGRAHDSIQPSP